ALQSVLRVLRDRAGELEPGRRLSLTDLALALAHGEHGVSVPERQALAALEGSLGIVGPEATSALLAAGRPAAEPRRPQPSFDAAELADLLDGPQRAVRWRLRELLSTDEFAYVRDLPRAEYREQVLAWCRRLADEGLGALGNPVEHGGGGDTPAFLAAFETLAHHDLSLLVKFGVQFGLFGGSILQLGTERHHRELLPRAARLELPGGFAMTESGHGSNVQDLETVARYDAETQEFIVHTPHPAARKEFIGNAACHGRMVTVFARLHADGGEHGVHALLVPIRDDEGNPLPGVTIEDCGGKMGLEGVDNGILAFDRVRVPRQNLLDRFASVGADGTYSSPIQSQGKRFFTMLGTLVGGRVSVALASLSAAKSALTIAVRYGERRRQFGASGEPEAPVLDYLAHQRRLLPRLARTYALHFSLRSLADRYVEALDDDEKRREVETLAAGLKAYATWHCSDTVQICRECCGGAGYLSANRLGTLKADTDVFTTFEGDNVVLLQLVARNLLSGLRRQFGDMGLLSLARYLGDLAALSLAERNPVVTHDSRSEHLRDRDFHLGTLRYRAERQLRSLARRLKERLDAGVDPQAAVSDIQDHMLAAAYAHVESFVLQRFDDAVTGLDEGPIRAVLERLRQFYALAAIEADRGWFLEADVLSDGKSRAIRAEINRLCGEIRHDARALVDAFRIPDPLLAAPIAVET
ncbi:MAG: acyl-CoA dehydrogenase, partial [Thermoanaerobaculia bacterium]